MLQTYLSESFMDKTLDKSVIYLKINLGKCNHCSTASQNVSYKYALYVVDVLEYHLFKNRTFQTINIYNTWDCLTEKKKLLFFYFLAPSADKNFIELMKDYFGKELN